MGGSPQGPELEREHTALRADAVRAIRRSSSGDVQHNAVPKDTAAVSPTAGWWMVTEGPERPLRTWQHALECSRWLTVIA